MVMMVVEDPVVLVLCLKCVTQRVLAKFLVFLLVLEKFVGMMVTILNSPTTRTHDLKVVEALVVLVGLQNRVIKLDNIANLPLQLVLMPNPMLRPPQMPAHSASP